MTLRWTWHTRYSGCTKASKLSLCKSLIRNRLAVHLTPGYREKIHTVGDSLPERGASCSGPKKGNPAETNAAGVESGSLTFDVDGHSLFLACASRPRSHLLKRRLRSITLTTGDERITAYPSAVRAAGAGIAAAAPAESSTMNRRSLQKIGCDGALECQVWLKRSLDSS